MNLAESLASLRNKLETIDAPSLNEDKGHLDHPEDLVFLGDITGANRAVDAIAKTVTNPKTVTIKWDGYPALIFGRDTNGNFSIMDKHMFNKVDGTGRQVYKPQQFVQYDSNRGVDRSELHNIIAEIWPGLEQASRGSVGYYWGDLLFSQPLKNQNGEFVFKANPKGITYKVAVNSEVGQLLNGKTAGIAVHQYLSPDAPERAAEMSTTTRKVAPTDLAESLNGTIGNLKNNSDIAIVPSKMPITPKSLKLDQKLLAKAKQDIAKYGQAVDQLMNSAPQARNTFNQLFTVYINKRIVGGNLNDLLSGFMEFVATRPMTDKMKAKIDEHLQANTEGLIGAFTIWMDIYNLKMNVVEQLNKAAEASPVQGYLDDGTNTHEGFVANGLKFVDRMGFSRQNLAGRT
jgi:hypothetical protein